VGKENSFIGQQEKLPFVFEDLVARPLMVLLVLSCLATLIYSNTFSATFHFDSILRIVENPKIKHLSNLLDLSGSRYVGYLSFAINYYFGGLNVFGYHLVNLLIHITNGFLVYLLVHLLFKTPKMLSSTSVQNNFTRTPFVASWIALATALLFVAHPIQTQAVTYIVQRFASLATLFYLLTVVLYLKWRLSPPHIKYRSVLFIGALVSTVLAMKTKEMTFTLPFMLLLIETVFLGPFTRKRWLTLIPFLLMLMIIPLSRPGDAGLAKVTEVISRSDYLFTQFRVIVTYLRLLIYPVNQNLEYDYPIFDSMLEPQVFLSFLFLLTLFFISVYFLFAPRFISHSLRLAGFGLLWFFLTLSIESSIIPLGRVIFEHRLYLPSIGFFLAASVVIIGASRRRKVLKGLTIGGLVLLLSMATYQRNLIWKDELTLWTDVVEKSPKKYVGYLNLGKGYLESKELDKAIQQFKTVIQINPDSYLAHNNLGRAYQEQGKIEEAFRSFMNVLTLKPDFSGVYTNLGELYLKQGRHQEALREFKTAIILNPNDTDAHNNLGITYKQMGQYEQAIKAYQTALILDPDYAEIHSNLGNVFKEQGHLEEALKKYNKALVLKPDFALAHYNVGLVNDQQGNFGGAVVAYEKAVQFKPDFAEAHNNLGIAYKNLGRLNEATHAFQTALRIKPDYTMAFYNLGNTYRQLGNLKEAIREYQGALRINPDLSYIHNSLGIVYGELGQLDNAIREFEIALKINPQFLEARKNVEMVYREKKKRKNKEKN